MSRIGKMPVTVPAGVDVSVKDDQISVKGKGGALHLAQNALVKVSSDAGKLSFAPANDSRAANAMSGTMRQLVNNMVMGVTAGFEKKLSLVGVGYKAQAQGTKLNLTVGYSHPVNKDMPEGITVQTPTPTEIVVKGADRQRVGQVEATYATNGLGGSRLIRTGGFPGTIVGTENTSFGTVLGQILTADFPTWTLGFTLSYPIGKSAEEANHARARLERDQATARLRSVELAAVREVRDAALRLEQNRQRIETAQLGRDLAEQRLDAEQKRFEVGMSTSFLVIQAQRDLAVARNNELQASLDYQLAVIAFEAAQRTSR